MAASLIKGRDFCAQTTSASVISLGQSRREQGETGPPALMVTAPHGPWVQDLDGKLPEGSRAVFLPPGAALAPGTVPRPRRAWKDWGRPLSVTSDPVRSSRGLFSGCFSDTNWRIIQFFCPIREIHARLLLR